MEYLHGNMMVDRAETRFLLGVGHSVMSALENFDPTFPTPVKGWNKGQRGKLFYSCDEICEYADRKQAETLKIRARRLAVKQNKQGTMNESKTINNNSGCGYRRYAGESARQVY